MMNQSVEFPISKLCFLFYGLLMDVNPIWKINGPSIDDGWRCMMCWSWCIDVLEKNWMEFGEIWMRTRLWSFWLYDSTVDSETFHDRLWTHKIDYSHLTVDCEHCGIFYMRTD